MFPEYFLFCFFFWIIFLRSFFVQFLFCSCLICILFYFLCRHLSFWRSFLFGFLCGHFGLLRSFFGFFRRFFTGFRSMLCRFLSLFPGSKGLMDLFLCFFQLLFCVFRKFKFLEIIIKVIKITDSFFLQYHCRNCSGCCCRRWRGQWQGRRADPVHGTGHVDAQGFDLVD